MDDAEESAPYMWVYEDGRVEGRSVPSEIIEQVVFGWNRDGSRYSYWLDRIEGAVCYYKYQGR